MSAGESPQIFHDNNNSSNEMPKEVVKPDKLSGYILLSFKNCHDEFYQKLELNAHGAEIIQFERDELISEYLNMTIENQEKSILVVQDSLLQSEDLYMKFFSQFYDSSPQCNLKICTLNYFLEECSVDEFPNSIPESYPMISTNLNCMGIFIDTGDIMENAYKNLIVQSLGGIPHQTLSKDLCYVICSSLNLYTYKIARKFNLNILQVSFLNSLLKKRGNISDYMVKNHMLLPFTNCVIYLKTCASTAQNENRSEFAGFMDNLKQYITNNGGKLANSQNFYTHLVVCHHDGNAILQSHELRRSIYESLSDKEKAYALMQSWIVDCAKCQYYLDIEDYLIKFEENTDSNVDSDSVSANDCTILSKKTSGSMDGNGFRKPLRSFSIQKGSTTSSGSSSDKFFASVFKPYNSPFSTTRFSILAEIIETELKFLKELNFIDEVYGRRISCSSSTNLENCLSMAEYKTVFQPVKDLLKLHSEMYEKLSILGENYDEITTCIGSVFIEVHFKFEKHYKFLRRYGDLSKIMSRASFENIFREFSNNINNLSHTYQIQPIKACEFVFRAFQRLSSYVVILDRLVKKTKQEHIDYPKLRLAAQQMKHFMSSLNENTRKFENELIHMELVCYLDQCPKVLESSKYALYLHTECNSVSMEGKVLKGMHLYLFESCIEIARHKAISKPIFSPKGFQKPRAIIDAIPIRKMKHVELINMKDCREMIYIKDPKFGELLVISYVKHESKQPALFAFKCFPQSSTLDYCREFHVAIRKYFNNFEIDEENENPYSDFLAERDGFLSFVKEWNAQYYPQKQKLPNSSSADLVEVNTRRLSTKFLSAFNVFKVRPIRPSVSYQSLDELK